VKLQRLELFGFKSFADRVAIEFNPGITAIVGPNGCGKSNISDAIRWVLGEQRPTLVRGSRMDEVIFSGSRHRKPINLAEVALHFSNEDGLLPIEYTEVAIARRVFRDGDSDYLLNRHPCRLKDIQDLLMGTGIGTHSYTLIQQGMVDSLLSDRPEERRTILRKLEATAIDLDRVEDVVSEVDRNVASLKRQVGKARRFLKYQAEETRLDVHLAACELESAEKRRAPLAAELRELQEKESELAARLADREAGVETMEVELIELRQQEHTARAAVEAVRSRIARHEEVRLVNGETLKHHRQRLEELATEAEQARVRSDDLAERRANLEVDLAAAREQVARIAERMAPSETADEEQRRAELKVEQRRLTERLESLRERLAEVDQARARQATAAESAEERLSALSAELESREREASESGTAVDRARAAVEAAEAQRSEADKAREIAKSAADVLSSTVDAIRERLETARAAEQTTAGRRSALTDLEARFEGYASGARSLLGGSKQVRGVYGALPQVLESIDRRFEKALDRYLESLGHGLLAKDQKSALAAAEQLDGNNAGRADFLIPELISAADPPSIPDAAAALVLARGSDVVRWTGHRKLPERFEPLFHRLLIVANAGACFSCRSALQGHPRAAGYYTIAGLDGTLLEPIGRWRTAGSENGHGLLSRRRQLAEAETEFEARRADVAELTEELGQADRGLAENKAAISAAGDQWRQADGSFWAGREALVAAEEAVTHAARRRAELEAEIGEQKAARDRANQAQEAVAKTHAELTIDAQRATERLTAVRTALERYDEVRTERLSARHAVELERTASEADLRVVERDLEHLGAAESALEEARSGRAGERARLEEECTRLAADAEAAGAEIEGLYVELETVEVTSRGHRETLAAIEERSGHDSELRGLRREHDAAIERRHQCELTLQEIEHRRQTIKGHIQETYETDLAPLVAEHPLEEEEKTVELDELKTRLEAVRRKRANLGPVNMLAVEEFERESERLEFLVSSRRRSAR
jgi:chromosome segregation protein